MHFALSLMMAPARPLLGRYAGQLFDRRAVPLVTLDLHEVHQAEALLRADILKLRSNVEDLFRFWVIALPKSKSARSLDNVHVCSNRSFSFPEAIACQDRKSTRLNSSHLGISYAVFCLKK